MKAILTTIFFSFIYMASYGQELFSSRKGTKFFPGHLDIAVSVDENNVKYELFNHWYSRMYSQLRQIEIPINSLKSFNQDNDSILIKIFNNKVSLTDKRYKLNRKVRHRSLCNSIENMRKISFAVDLALQHSIGPHGLYSYEDLKLDEIEFKQKVLGNLNKKEK
ncbi:hypothetical protein HUW51_16260 [Adhaeribacter swui]|uniref:Uncharacterized protein n=1 Tax=Adhaeribacter swui TaxID=2086471 RepID=A0A7G7GAL3_9BACT|nr:hypothetical protein [Adhaeribacter swui]QNF34197.1 hypothetical protein HUW51_16260 [Adhaeribacter swui]